MKKMIISIIMVLFIVNNVFSLTVHLLDGTQINGNLISRKDDKLYITLDKSLYIISEHIILKVFDEEKDVTELVKTSKKNQPIKWNSYLKIITLNTMKDVRKNYPNLVLDTRSIRTKNLDSQQKLLLSAGKNLQKSSFFWYSGIVLSTVGLIFFMKADNDTEINIGIGFNIAGTLAYLIAPAYIGKAGNDLEEMSFTEQNKK